MGGLVVCCFFFVCLWCIVLFVYCDGVVGVVFRIVFLVLMLSVCWVLVGCLCCGMCIWVRILFGWNGFVLLNVVCCSGRIWCCLFVVVDRWLFWLFCGFLVYYCGRILCYWMFLVWIWLYVNLVWVIVYCFCWFWVWVWVILILCLGVWMFSSGNCDVSWLGCCMLDVLLLCSCDVYVIVLVFCWNMCVFMCWFWVWLCVW